PANGIVFASLLLGLWAAIRLIQGKRFGDLTGRWTWRRVGLGAGVWSVVLVAATLLDLAIRPSGFKVTAGTLTPAIVAVAMLCLAVQTFAEEWVFRGWITQGLLLAFRGRPLATSVVAGLIFGSVHVPNGLPQAANAVAFGVATS